MAALGKEVSTGGHSGGMSDRSSGSRLGLDHISNCKGDLAKRAVRRRPQGPSPRLPKSAASFGVGKNPLLPSRGLLSLCRRRAHTSAVGLTGRLARASFWKTC